MAELTRDQILARKLGGGQPFNLPDGSGSVVLRGMTLDEGMSLNECETQAARNHLLLHYGFVSPALSVEDAAAWCANDSVGVLTSVANRISEMSGMQEGAGKSGPPSSGRRSRS